MYIEEHKKIEINGVKQHVSIIAQKDNLPLLLYLHGGPGDAALPLVMKYNKELTENFTLVIWEQRGAGKSYYKFIKPVTIGDYLDDLHQLVKLLLERFNQEKLYIIGHSWGSVLGLSYINLHPEYVHKYIGCGQVVNMRKSCQAAYDFALLHAEGKALDRLKNIDCSYRSDNWLKDLLFVTGQVVKHKGSLYGRNNYNDLIKPFLFSSYYTISDIIRRQKGSLQSIKFLWQELMETDFERYVEYDVPIVFIEGRYDSHVSSDIAKEYYESINSDKEFYWFDKSCHFPQWSEKERFNSILAELAE